MKIDQHTKNKKIRKYHWHNFKIYKKVDFIKLCLSVKPPLEKRPSRHIMKYLKIVILMGG